MKLKCIKLRLLANGSRCTAVLLASVCLIWAGFISSSAQLKTQKHVTSLQLGQAAEGARVTVISDGTLNDYEAFRRGDRFYVKIPQAEFAFSQPNFHGDGFDDVQVQKVGDSVVVSFKLQPGASAHVEEHSNRLDVIFNAPNRSQRTNVASNPTSAGVNRSSANQGSQDRQRAAAGPEPSDGPQTSRQRFVTGRRNESNETVRQPAQSTKTQHNQGKPNTLNTARAATPPAATVASPPVRNYPTPSYTPATATITPLSSTGSKPTGVSVNSAKTLGEWFSANQKGSLLGALLLAGALVLVVALLYRGRTKKGGAPRAKTPLAQPKYDSKANLNELTVSRPDDKPAVAAPSGEAPQKSDWSRVASQPVFASAGEASAGRTANRSQPSNNSVVVADNQSVNEEREVFEL
jgi:hypothetical protein